MTTSNGLGMIVIPRFPSKLGARETSGTEKENWCSIAEKKRNNSSLARDSPIQTRRPEIKKETLDYEMTATKPAL